MIIDHHDEMVMNCTDIALISSKESFVDHHGNVKLEMDKLRAVIFFSNPIYTYVGGPPILILVYFYCIMYFCVSCSFDVVLFNRYANLTCYVCLK